MKYKICKLVDGNGREWYQIKKKGWILWNWVCDSHFETEIEFSTEQSAKEYIEKQSRIMNNPHRRYKNCKMDQSDIIQIILGVLLFIIYNSVIVAWFCLNPITLNSIHKKNIEKPPAQQYTLNQCDPIWFYKPDEIGWTKGRWTIYGVIIQWFIVNN